MSYFDDLLNEALPSEFDSGENMGGSDMYEGANMDMKKEFKSAMRQYKAYMNSAKQKFKNGNGDCIAASNDVKAAITALENAKQIINSLNASVGTVILGSMLQTFKDDIKIGFFSMIAAGAVSGGDMNAVAKNRAVLSAIAGLVTTAQHAGGIFKSWKSREGGKLSVQDFNTYKNKLVKGIEENITAAKKLEQVIKKAATAKGIAIESAEDFENMMDDFFNESSDDESEFNPSEFESGEEDLEDLGESGFDDVGEDEGEEEEFDPFVDGEEEEFDPFVDGEEDLGDDEECIDSDLDDLAREVGINGSLDDSSLGDGEDDSTYTPISVDDATPAPPVSKEKDVEGDKMMAMVATPMVLDDTLTQEEAKDFCESGDAEIAVNEGFLMESDLSMMLAELSASSNTSVFTEGGKFATGKQKFKMTKKAKLKQLFELSLQIEARQHHDPYYPKIQKAYKIEREIKAGWRKRYGALAAKRAKRYLKALMMSKSKTLKTAGKRMAN